MVINFGSIILIKFHLCSRTPTSQASCQYSIPSAASRYRSGKKKVIVALCSPERSHQETHRSGHPVFGTRDNGYQRYHFLHYLPQRGKGDSRNQTALPRHDHQKCTAVLT